MSDPNSWSTRYNKAYGLPTGRSPQIRQVNNEQEYERMKTLDGAGVAQKGGLNDGIYLVKRRDDGTDCVQKKISLDSKMLQREVHLLHHLRHPHIIEFIDAFITERPQSCSLFMEYCDAGSLDDVIQSYARHNRELRGPNQRRMPEGFMWHVFDQMASALQYLHHGLKPYDPCPIPYPSDPANDDQATSRLSKNWPVIVHRDIKPANIFLEKGRLKKSLTTRPRRRTLGLTSTTETSVYREYPRIVLADFGLSYMKGDRDFKNRSLAGTPTWWPPEIPSQSALGDIWQLGGLIWSLIRLDRRGPVPTPPSGRRLDVWCASKEAHRGLDRVKVPPPYSEDLQLMLHMCMANDQRARPYAFRLIRMVEEGKSRARSMGLLSETQTLPRWATK